MWHKIPNILRARKSNVKVCVGNTLTLGLFASFVCFLHTAYKSIFAFVGRVARQIINFFGVAAAAVITIAWEIIGAFSQHPEHDPTAAAECESDRPTYSRCARQFMVDMHALFLTDLRVNIYVRVHSH
jgi:hypothetical protein